MGDPTPPPEGWIKGLSKNPAAPDDVVERLLSIDAIDFSTRKEWSDKIAEVALNHPDPKVRRNFAVFGGDQRFRLARDPVVKVRRALAACWEFGRRLPEEVLDILADDPDGHVRWEVVHHPNVPRQSQIKLLSDPMDDIRAEARERFGEAERPPGGWTPMTAEEADALVTSENAETRERAARNPLLPVDVVRRLTRDPEFRVRLAASSHPALTEDERASIDIEIDPEIVYRLPEWTLSLPHDAVEVRRHAASAHVLIRRGLARRKDLPQDVKERFAADEDFVVRLLLAENSDDVPVELLLEIWREWEGLSQWRIKERIPRQGLRRFADDPHPRMRALALGDPQTPPELVDELSRDEEPWVRWCALRDPRLTPERVTELLEDDDPNLHRGAAADPRLPLARLLEALEETRLAAAAARNPALPMHIMHELLDRAGVADRQ
ncbi:glycyl-tRNA synthetase [Actinomadura verrucosospora]|uniref:Glycyl-tRNA synthetase n=1 Tax=Actinomadura verrucosospora TaxID=46165 RepID=A0A7D3ZT56_ACTVE|nr:glycyl-tRNA synthetase [Actinomadura verrucosospora]